MNSTLIAAAFESMNSSQIITALEQYQAAGVNISSIDVPAVLSSLNITQVEGLLESNSTTVNGLLQGLQPSQLLTVLYNFQNVTSQLFTAASLSNSTSIAKAYSTEAQSLLSLLLIKINNVFTDSQLLGVFSILSSGATIGTGSKKLVNIAHKLMNGFTGGVTGQKVDIPARLLKLVSDYQPTAFGGYPRYRDIAPSSIFMAIFFFFTLAHLWIFGKNYARGHKFYVSFALAFYSLIRTLGFLLRIVWAKHSLEIGVGLASTIFLVLPTVFLPTLNMVLAQRYFTWRHPLYGSHRLFTSFQYLMYSLMVGIVVMNIIAICVQTDYFLSKHHFKMTKQVTQACSVMVTTYSLFAITLVGLAFIIPPTKSDKGVLTSQPYWIKSFNIRYFVEKGAAQREAALITEDQTHAIRIIHSTNYHHETIHDNEVTDNEALNLKQNHSIVIIGLTSVALFISDVFRCVSTFIEQYVYYASWIFDPVVMYIMFGVLETFVNVLYLVGRIDLRFYKPDAFNTKPFKATTDETKSTPVNKELSPTDSGITA